MGCLLFGFLVCRLGVTAVCVCYSCIPFGISNVSGCFLLFVCACDLFFVWVCSVFVILCVELVSMCDQHTEYSSLRDESSVELRSNTAFARIKQYFLFLSLLLLARLWLNIYLLTPWCRVLLEKLTGLQLVKKFPAFHGTRRFITTLTSVCQLSLS